VIRNEWKFVLKLVTRSDHHETVVCSISWRDV